MRRRAMGVAGLAIVFGVMLVCFGATAGLADRCKPDEHGGHGHDHDDCPDPTVPTTVPVTDAPTTPATTPPTTPAHTPATTPATTAAATPAPAPLRSTPPPATSAAPAPTSARSKASVAASASPVPRPRSDGAAAATTAPKGRDAATHPATEPAPSRTQPETSSTTAPPSARFELASAGEPESATRVRAHLAADACARNAPRSAVRGRVLVLHDRHRASLSADVQGSVIASMSTTTARAIPAAEPEKAASPNANTPPSAATSQ